MFKLGSDTSRQRYVSARFRDALKRRKIKNEIKLKVQTLKSTQPLIRHSHLFQSGDSSKPPPSFRRLGGRPKRRKTQRQNGCGASLFKREWVSTLFTGKFLGWERSGVGEKFVPQQKERPNFLKPNGSHNTYWTSGLKFVCGSSCFKKTRFGKIVGLKQFQKQFGVC